MKNTEKQIVWTKLLRILLILGSIFSFSICLSAQSGPGTSGLYDFISAIDRADYRYLYALDGKDILRDAHGNPRYRDMDLMYGMQGDLAKWEALVEAEMEKALAGVKIKLEEEEALNDATYTGVLREFQRIYTLRKKTFLKRRLKDLYSLRRKNEKNHAREALERELEKIQLGLSNYSFNGIYEKGNPGLKFHEISGQDIEEGISDWKKLEDEYFHSRHGWENRAYEILKKEETQWREGFSRWEEQHLTWKRELKELFENGETEWKKSEDEFLKRYGNQMEAILAEKDSALEVMDRDLKLIEGEYHIGRERMTLAEQSLGILQPMAGEEGIQEEIEYWEDQYQLGLKEMDTAKDELYQYASQKGGFTNTRDFLEGEIAYLKNRLNILNKEVDVVEDLLTYAEDTTSNRPREVESEKRFIRAEEEYTEAKGEYETSLSRLNFAFKEKDDSVEAWKRKVEESLERLETAELEYRRAEAIINYASHGYTPEGYEPDILLRERLEERSEVERTLKLLVEISIDKESSDLLSRGNWEYLDLGRKTQEKEEQLSWLHEANEKMAKRLISLERSMENELEKGLQLLEDFFTHTPTREEWKDGGFQTRSLPDLTKLTMTEMEDLSYNANELAEMGSTWITGLLHGKNPDKLLSHFGLAFYHETRSRGEDSLRVDDDSTLNTLLDKTDLSADEILNKEGRKSYRKVKDDPEYAFFKLLLLRNWNGPLLSEQFIKNDAKGFLSRKGKSKAQTLIVSKQTAGAINAGIAAGLWASSFFCPWLIPQAIFHSGLAASFYTEADRLKALKDTTKDYSGEEDRKGIIREAESYMQKEAEFNEMRRKWTTITGLTREGNLTEEGITLDGLMRSFSEVMSVPEGLAESLPQYWQFLGAPGSYPEALSELVAIYNAEGEALRYEWDNKARHLLARRDDAYHRYRGLLNAGETETGEFRTLVRSLFESPELTRQDYWRYQWDLEKKKKRGGADFSTLLHLVRGEISRNIEHDYRGRTWIAELEKDLFEKRRLRWQTQMKEIYKKGETQWQEALSEIEQEYALWNTRRQEELERGVSLWNQKHRLIEEGISVWGREIQNRISKVVEEEYVETLGLERNWVSQELHGVMIPELSPLSKGIRTAVEASLSRKKRMGEFREWRRTFAGSSSFSFHSSSVFSELPAWDVLNKEEMITDNLSKLNEIQARAVHAKSLLTRHMAYAVEDRIHERIKEINLITERNVRSRLLQSGYILENSHFIREAIIDDSLFGGVETEIHSIAKYKFFIAPSMELGVDLSSRGIRGLSSELVNSRTTLAVNRLKNYASLIFGNFEKGSEKSLLSNLGEEFREAYLKQAEGFLKGKPKGEGGLIFFHIGYAPEMGPENPEEVLKDGWGEYGRIFKDFFINEARLGRGLATLQQSFYNLRLWDDDHNNDGESDTLIKAPTLRSVADLAVNIASHVIVPGGGLLVNLLDDAGFAFLDAGTGERALGESLFDLGKTAMTGLLHGGLNSGFGGMVTDSLSGIGKVALDTVVSGTKATLQHLGTELIDGFTLDDGSLAYTGEDVLSSFLSYDTLARISSAGASSLVNSGLTELNNWEGHIPGFSSTHMRDLGEFNALSGSLTGAAVDYAISGDTTLNLLNFRDLAHLADLSWFKNSRTGEWYSQGLLEWELGGKGDLSLGGGGVDVGVSRNLMAASGLDLWGQDLRIRNFTNHMGEDLAEGLRFLYSFGDEQGHTLYRSLMDHGLGVKILSNENTDYLGATRATRNLTKQILLHPHLINGGRDQMLLGVLLQHEAYRDGKVGPANREETLRAVTGHSEMALRIAEDPYYGAKSLLEYPGLFLDAAVYAGDSSFFDDFAGTLYSSEGDFWKLLDNGTIVWDGRRDLRAQGGHLLREDRTQSLSKSLYTYLGEDGAEKVLQGMGISTKGKSVEELAYSLMTGSGAFWDEKQGGYKMMTVAGYKDAPGKETGLSDLLRFSVSQERALALGKIPQYSPDIMWENEEGKNIMRRYGCFFMSVLGAVQSQAGENLLPEEITSVVKESYDRGYMRADMFTVDKEGISRLAFEQLGKFKKIRFTPQGADGTLLVGATGRNTVHAREGNSRGEEIFDPYPWATYMAGEEFKEVRPYSVEAYTPTWEEYKEVQLRNY